MKKLLLAVILSLVPISASATNAPDLLWYARDVNGKALVGAKLYFYQATTAIAKNVYSDETCGTSLGAVLTSDATGRFPRFYMGALNDCSSALLYKVVLKTAAGATVWTEDNIAGLKTNLGSAVSASSAGLTPAVFANNSANGVGVYALNTGTAWGLMVQADTSTPVRAAMNIVPQDTTPSSPTKGDLWFDTTTGKIRFYNGTIASEVCASGTTSAAAPGTNHNGAVATGNGTGNGFSGTGGTTSGAGGYFTGGAPNGYGIDAHATGNGYAGRFVGGSGSSAIYAVTDAATAAYVNAAVYGAGYGEGAGVSGYAAGTGYGCMCGVELTGHARAQLHLDPLGSAPVSALEGDVYYNSAVHHLYVRTNVGWAQLD